MKNKFIFTVIFFLVLIGLSSCSMSIEKRRYRSGYYVDMVKPVSQKRISENHLIKVNSNELKPRLLSVSDSLSENQNNYSNVLVDSKPTTNLLPRKRSRILPKVLAQANLYDNGCDTVYFKNGTIKLVTSVRMVERKLYYNNCGENTRAVTPIDVKTIKYIRFADGRQMDPEKDYKELVKKNKSDYEDKDRKSGRIVATILMAIFGVIMAGIAALFFFLAATASGYGGIVVAILCYPLGVLFAIGAIILIAFAFVTGFRK